MSVYEAQARAEMQAWQQAMLRSPGLFNRATRSLQRRLNSYIPERVHDAITAAVKQMTRAVLTGSQYTSPMPLQQGSLYEREYRIRDKIDAYRRAAAVEGGITGAGGLLLGFADFPILIAVKFKLLFEIASLYGHATEDYRERMYLLYVFQLAFCSDARRRELYLRLADWRNECARLPVSIEAMDWRVFQQEYRDYIDLAKLAQLVPIIGAPVGLVVNHRLVRKLGITAMNAYRLRWFDAAQQPAMLPRGVDS